MNWKGKNPYYLKHVINALKSYNNSDGVTTNQIIGHLQARLPRNDAFSMALNVRNALRQGLHNNLITINPERYILKRTGKKITSRHKTVYCVSSNSTVSSNQYVKCTCKYHNASSDAVSLSGSSSATSVAHYRSKDKKNKKHRKQKTQSQKRKSPSAGNTKQPSPPPLPCPDVQNPDSQNKTPTEAEAVKSNLSLRNLSKHDILSEGHRKSDLDLGHRRRGSNLSCNSPKYSTEYIN